MNVSCPQCTSVFRVDPAKVPAGGVRARCSVCGGTISVPEPSFEEPVASGASGGTGLGTSSPWGRVETPSGGWSSPPPTPPGAVPSQTGWAAGPGTASPADWGGWPNAPEPFAGSEQSAASWPPSGGPYELPMGIANPLAPEVPTPAREYAPAWEAPPAPVSPPETATPPGATEETSAPEIAAQAPPAPASPAPVATPAPPAPAYKESAPAVTTPGAHVNPYLRRDPHERAKRLARALASDIVTYYPEKHGEGLRDGTLKELFREEIKKSYEDYTTQVGADLAQSTTYFQDALNEVLAGGKRLF